jgi:hypothetical protein
MLALNNVATMRRLKPKRWLGLMSIFAVFTLIGIFALGSGEWWAWVCLIMFGGGGAMFLVMGIIHRGSPYQPGLSFKGLRMDRRQIGATYRAAAWTGAAVCLGFLVYGLIAGSILGVVADAIGGLLLIVFAFAGLAAGKVHRDVDPAVAALAATLDPLRASQIEIACSSFEPARASPRKGATMLAADVRSLSLSRHDGRQWLTERRVVADIAELGLLTEEQSLIIYFRFRDETEFVVELDPFGHDATEPYALCRSLLELIDRSVRLG